MESIYKICIQIFILYGCIDTFIPLNKLIDRFLQIFVKVSLQMDRTVYDINY